MTRLATIARRHRWGHAILFTVAVALLVGTAAVDPLLTRSFQNAVVKFHTQGQGLVGNQVTLTSRGEQTRSISDIEHAVYPRVHQVTGDPTESTSVVATSERTRDIVRIQYTKGACQHVHLLRGRCPTARNEVMLSQAAVAQVLRPKLKLGEELPVTGFYPPAELQHLNPHKTMRLVGVFTASPTAPFWGGAAVADYTLPVGTSTQPAAYWLTDRATFTGQVPIKPLSQDRDAPASVSWSGITYSVSYPVLTSKVTPETLHSAAAGARRTLAKNPDLAAFESLNQVEASTHQDIDQVGQILPFLLVQLGVVLAILLVQVTSYFATVRRGEAAVLKMRGNGTAGVIRLGIAEFLPAYVVGVVGGLGLAYVVDGLVRHLWLPGSVAAEWNWASVLVALGMAALIAGVWLLCWWLTARGSISELLRARPPRRRGVRLSTPAAALAAVCLVGVVLTATKSLTGAPVQVTPVLLAGLVAIVVGALLAPVAAWLVRRLMVRRRPAAALAVAQLGRRAGVVTAVTTLIITAALLTLSVSVFSQGADNRAARAAADTGAGAFVFVPTGDTSVDGQTLIDAVNSVDPHHRQFTPALQIDASTQTSYSTLGVIPADMERIGATTGVQRPVPWSALQSGTTSGKPSALVATWTTNAAVGSLVTAPTMADVDGEFRVVGAVPYIPGAGERTIVVDLQTMLHAGDRRTNLSYQVYSGTQDPKALARLDKVLRKAGFASTEVHTIGQARAGYDATATAWAMNLSLVVSALSVLAALVSVVLVAVASRPDRERDLRALSTGGLSGRILRAATVGEFVLLALLGSVIGAATAPVAAWLTGRTMLWWSTPPDEPLTETGFRWPAGLSAAAALIVLLLLVATVFGIRIARSAVRPGKESRA